MLRATAFYNSSGTYLNYRYTTIVPIRAQYMLPASVRSVNTARQDCLGDSCTACSSALCLQNSDGCDEDGNSVLPISPSLVGGAVDEAVPMVTTLSQAWARVEPIHWARRTPAAVARRREMAVASMNAVRAMLLQCEPLK